MPQQASISFLPLPSHPCTHFCDRTPKAPFCTHSLLGVLHFQASCQLGLSSLCHTINVWLLYAMANPMTHFDTSTPLPSVTSSLHHLHSAQVSIPSYRICLLLPSSGPSTYLPCLSPNKFPRMQICFCPRLQAQWSLWLLLSTWS